MFIDEYSEMSDAKLCGLVQRMNGSEAQINASQELIDRYHDLRARHATKQGREVISLSVSATDEDINYVAVCRDGTMWHMAGPSRWTRLPSIPQD